MQDVKLVKRFRNEYFEYDFTVSKRHASKTEDELSAAITMVAMPSMIVMNLHKTTLMYILSCKLKQELTENNILILRKHLYEILRKISHDESHSCQSTLILILIRHDYKHPSAYDIHYFAYVFSNILNINSSQFFTTVAQLFGTVSYSMTAVERFIDELQCVDSPLVDHKFIALAITDLKSLAEQN